MSADTDWEIFDRFRDKADELRIAARRFPPGVKVFDVEGQTVFPIYEGAGGFPKWAEAFLVPAAMQPKQTFPRDSECVAFDVLKTSPAEALARFMRKFPATAGRRRAR